MKTSNASERAHVCFAEGTLVHTAFGTRAIEEIEPGDRVLCLNDEERRTSVVDKSWCWIELEILDEINASRIFVTLLRSPLWMKETAASVGGEIEYTLEPSRLAVKARVTAIGVSPPISDDPGHIVLSALETTSQSVVALSVRHWRYSKITTSDLSLTAAHALCSIDRAAWVAADRIRVGERIRSLEGEAEVVSIGAKSGVHRVYNLEVETHCGLLVSALGVLARSYGSMEDQEVEGVRFDRGTG